MNDLKSSEDEELVVLYKAGIEKAFDELFLRYSGKIKRVIFFYLSNLENSDDVFQEVFIRVYRHINKFKVTLSFSAWIYQIAINCCKNYIKKNKRNDTIIEKEIVRIKSANTPYLTPEEQILKDLDLKCFNRAIDSLDSKFKDVFLLRYDQRLKYNEIARILICSERTAKWRMNKAVTVIIKFLKDNGIT